MFKNPANGCPFIQLCEWNLDAFTEVAAGISSVSLRKFFESWIHEGWQNRFRFPSLLMVWQHESVLSHIFHFVLQTLLKMKLPELLITVGSCWGSDPLWLNPSLHDPAGCLHVRGWTLVSYWADWLWTVSWPVSAASERFWVFLWSSCSTACSAADFANVAQKLSQALIYFPVFASPPPLCISVAPHLKG